MLVLATSISSGRRRLFGGCAGALAAASAAGSQLNRSACSAAMRRWSQRSPSPRVALSACQRGASRRITPLPGSVTSTRSAAKSPISEPFGPTTLSCGVQPSSHAVPDGLCTAQSSAPTSSSTSASSDAPVPPSQRQTRRGRRAGAIAAGGVIGSGLAASSVMAR